MFLFWLRQLPWCGDQTPASVPLLAKGRSSHTNTVTFPPSSFILPSFAWFYLFFSAGQVLLSAPSWCPACTSVSEGVFLMYPRREMYSVSTYSRAILFPPLKKKSRKKKLCTAKETINKMKRQPMEWENIFANYICDETVISKIHKDLT